MCMICAARRPGDLLSRLDSHGAEDGAKAIQPGGIADHSINQIVRQLVSGYWASEGEGPRGFDAGPGSTLTYDLTDLTAAERHIARAALEAWTDVTGIRFAAFTAPTLSAQTEGGDAPSDPDQARALALNTRLDGTLSTGGDQDAFAVTLRAGQTVHIAMEGRGAGGTEDPLLRLFDANGEMVAENDDFGGFRDSYLSFTATRAGSYRIVAASFDGDYAGDYRLSVSTAPQIADITLTHSDPEGDGGAYSTSQTDGARILASLVSIEEGWDNDPVSINSYWFQTYMHEIGHALGLGHPGDYNGDALWGRDQEYSDDSWQTTVMSYFSQEDNPNVNASYAFALTPMIADIAAIQSIYGSDLRTRHGDTVYGTNSNAGGYLQRMFEAIFDNAAASDRDYIGNPFTLTLFDTGGRDRIDVSSLADDQRIDLRPGAASSVAGLVNNLLIARGVMIEDAATGGGDDRLLGNAVGNMLSGGAGRDTLNGWGGNDTLMGGAGADSMNGGAGRDTVLYAGAAAANVNLATQRASSAGHGEDRLQLIENATGGRGNDRLIGSDGANTLNGAGGRDYLDGGAGDDVLIGGAGDDRLIGGLGRDVVRFSGAADIRVDLSRSAAQQTGQGRDRLEGIEHAVTGGGDDRLAGSGGANRLNGQQGNDLLIGRGGADRLLGGGGNDRLQGGAGADWMAGGAGADRFVFTAGADTIADFAAGQDTLAIARGFWTGGGGVARMLDRVAEQTALGLELDFGAHSLLLRGIRSADAIADDIVLV